MKLNSTQVEQTLSQFHAEVLPDNHPAVRKLNDLFGDHTFFLDGSGLNVLEPTEMPEKEVQAGEIVSLASWSDETLTSLRPHEPEPTGAEIVPSVPRRNLMRLGSHHHSCAIESGAVVAILLSN